MSRAPAWAPHRHGLRISTDCDQNGLSIGMSIGMSYASAWAAHQHGLRISMGCASARTVIRTG